MVDHVFETYYFRYVRFADYAKGVLIFIVRNWECMAPINRLSKISQLDLGPSNTPRLSKKKVCTGIKTKQHLYRHHWKDCLITYSLVKLYGSVLALMSILRLNFWFFLFEFSYFCWAIIFKLKTNLLWINKKLY